MGAARRWLVPSACRCWARFRSCERSARRAIMGFRSSPPTPRTRRAGEVEGGPVEIAPVQVEEVDHLAVAQPADEVADGAAQDPADRRHDPRLLAGGPTEKGDERAGGAERDREEERESDSGGDVREHTEGSPRVAHVGDREDREPDDRLVKPQRARDEGLRRLVCGENPDGDREREPPARIPHATTVTQRAQRSGCRASPPTTRTFQQRGHFLPDARSTATRRPASTGLAGARPSSPTVTAAVRKSAGSSAAWAARSSARPSPCPTPSTTRASEDCFTTPA